MPQSRSRLDRGDLSIKNAVIGEGEIRTRGTIAGTRSFQDRQLNRSCTLPFFILFNNPTLMPFSWLGTRT